MLFWIDILDLENSLIIWYYKRKVTTQKRIKWIVIPIPLDSEEEEKEEEDEKAISLDRIWHFFVGVHTFFGR
jgi:hypothetical protein